MTASNALESHDPADLGDLEREVMQLIWRHEKTTADRVREDLARPLKDSTVRTVLRRLEEKGYVTHEVENRTFLYKPAEARQQVAARAVKRIVDWMCEGSVEALLVGMVDSRVLDKNELKQLAEKIATAKRGGR
jgi:predicted transcriptional regulator